MFSDDVLAAFTQLETAIKNNSWNEIDQQFSVFFRAMATTKVIDQTLINDYAEKYNVLLSAILSNEQLDTDETIRCKQFIESTFLILKIHAYFEKSVSDYRLDYLKRVLDFAKKIQEWSEPHLRFINPLGSQDYFDHCTEINKIDDDIRNRLLGYYQEFLAARINCESIAPLYRTNARLLTQSDIAQGYKQWLEQSTSSTSHEKLINEALSYSVHDLDHGEELRSHALQLIHGMVQTNDTKIQRFVLKKLVAGPNALRKNRCFVTSQYPASWGLLARLCLNKHSKTLLTLLGLPIDKHGNGLGLISTYNSSRNTYLLDYIKAMMGGDNAYMIFKIIRDADYFNSVSFTESNFEYTEAEIQDRDDVISDLIINWSAGQPDKGFDLFKSWLDYSFKTTQDLQRLINLIFNYLTVSYKPEELSIVDIERIHALAISMILSSPRNFIINQFESITLFYLSCYEEKYLTGYTIVNSLKQLDKFSNKLFANPENTRALVNMLCAFMGHDRSKISVRELRRFLFDAKLTPQKIIEQCGEKYALQFLVVICGNLHADISDQGKVRPIDMEYFAALLNLAKKKNIAAAFTMRIAGDTKEISTLDVEAGFGFVSLLHYLNNCFTGVIEEANVVRLCDFLRKLDSQQMEHGRIRPGFLTQDYKKLCKRLENKSADNYNFGKAILRYDIQNYLRANNDADAIVISMVYCKLNPNNDLHKGKVVRYWQNKLKEALPGYQANLCKYLERIKDVLPCIHDEIEGLLKEYKAEPNLVLSEFFGTSPVSEGIALAGPMLFPVFP